MGRIKVVMMMIVVRGISIVTRTTSKRITLKITIKATTRSVQK